MRKIMYLMVGVVSISLTMSYLIGADHVDAPAVGSLSSGSSTADIADLFAFESPSNPNNYVFICTVNALVAPSATASTKFNEDLMYEFNIDNDGDLVEDQVIQVFFEDGKAVTYGPVAPSMTGLKSVVESSNTKVEAEITSYKSSPVVGSSNGIKLFAGPTDDPFYFDLFKFRDIVNGVGASLSDDVNTGKYDGDRDSDSEMEGIQPYPASFDSANPKDALAGTNVLSVVVEIPKSMLKTSSTFNVWVESKSAQ
jgi:hypothetical protein